MKFTYKAYTDLLEWIKSQGYRFTTFEEPRLNKHIINRHDVDLSLEKALDIAKIDFNLGIKSTFFVLISSFFYNLMDKKNLSIINEIMNLNHVIGLHFDETQYPIDSDEAFENYLLYERDILSKIIGKEVKVFSNHRPSQFVLKGLSLKASFINAYSQENFIDTKYFSDSRMHWREDIYNKISSEAYQGIQLNTHPFWYSNKEESIKSKFIEFIKSQKKYLYEELSLGTRDFEKIISLKEKEADINVKIQL